MIVIGICIYSITTISKPVFIKSHYDGIAEIIFSSVVLRFRKNNPESILSFLQLIGLTWVGVGILELVLQEYLDKVPYILLSFLELFIPLVIVILVAKLLRK